MLQIRLRSAPSTEGAGGSKPLPVETVTVACPDHLVLADLPVAKGIGAAITASLVKTVGRRSRRQLGERIHFCVHCDFPIAIYGRLSPCEHAFCLDCARSDSICYLCDERIQKIQTIKLMEGIFICAAPHCLKSFLKRTEFESHIHERHADLLKSSLEKEDNNESDAQSAKQSTASDSTLRTPLGPVISPGSSSELQDKEDKACRQLTGEQSLPRPLMQPKPPQGFVQVENNPSESQPDSRPQGFDRPGPHNHFQHQNFDLFGTPNQESDGSFSEYPPMHSIQPPNYIMPANSNQMLNPPLPFGYPPFPVDGPQQFYNAPYEMVCQDSVPEAESEQGSLLGFPPGSAGNMNFTANFPQPWNNAEQAGVPVEPPLGSQGAADGFGNISVSQGKVSFYQGASPLTNKLMEPMPGGNAMDTRDGKGILAAQPMPLLPPPPPPPPAHLPQHKHKYYSGDMGRDGEGLDGSMRTVKTLELARIR